MKRKRTELTRKNSRRGVLRPNRGEQVLKGVRQPEDFLVSEPKSGGPYDGAYRLGPYLREAIKREGDIDPIIKIAVGRVDNERDKLADPEDECLYVSGFTSICIEGIK